MSKPDRPPARPGLARAHALGAAAALSALSQGASLRLDKLRADPARDARLAAELASLEVPYRREAATRARHGAVDAEFEQFGWLLEELRVSLFAQELKTPVPVSAKRLAKLWQTLKR